MTQHTELIARLRLGASISRERKLNQGYDAVADEAADAIEALEAERGQLQRDFTYMKQRRDDLQAEVGRLKSELSTTDVLLEECKMDWSGDVTQIKAEHKHEIDAIKAERDALQTQLAAAQGQEPVAYMVQFSPGSRWVEVTKVEFDSDIDGATVYKKQTFFATPIPQQVAKQAQPVQVNEWKDAVIDALVVAHILTPENSIYPRKAVQDVIDWNCQVALDPSVSLEAQALVDSGKPVQVNSDAETEAIKRFGHTERAEAFVAGWAAAQQAQPDLRPVDHWFAEWELVIPEDARKAFKETVQQAQPERGPSDDTARLNWLEAQGFPGLGWVARDSTTGRGYRLHQDSAGHVLVRDAIDAAIKQGGQR